MQRLRHDEGENRLPVSLLEATTSKTLRGYQSVRLHTALGIIEGRYFPAENAYAGVVTLGGAGGGWDSPARGLYEKLGATLPRAGVAVLQLKYREPANLEPCIHDARAAVRFLVENQGLKQAGLVGWSFGGAVAIAAGAEEAGAGSVVTIATQSYGTDEVEELGQPLLLIHGSEDSVLPARCSEHVFRRARQPKEIDIMPGNHGLWQSSRKVYDRVFDWFLGTLKVAGRC